MCEKKFRIQLVFHSGSLVYFGGVFEMLKEAIKLRGVFLQKKKVPRVAFANAALRALWQITLRLDRQPTCDGPSIGLWAGCPKLSKVAEGCGRVPYQWCHCAVLHGTTLRISVEVFQGVSAVVQTGHPGVPPLPGNKPPPGCHWQAAPIAGQFLSALTNS